MANAMAFGIRDLMGTDRNAVGERGQSASGIVMWIVYQLAFSQFVELDLAFVNGNCLHGLLRARVRE
jgi:hypothetical protein